VQDNKLLFSKGLKYFNDNFFWEAHEAWEDVWLDCNNSNDKLYIQGLIQAAAAFYHVLNSNKVGFERLSRLALEKFSKSTTISYQNITSDNLIQSLNEFRNGLDASNHQFDLSKIPKL